MSTNTFQYKYPLQQYIGNSIRGFAEVDENGVLHFFVFSNMCAPRTASSRFRGNITRYRQYVSKYVLSQDNFKDKLYPYLVGAKLKGYFYDGMKWKRNVGIESITEFERIIEGVGLVFSFDIDSSLDCVPFTQHNDFILTMLNSLDKVFDSVQQDCNDALMFVPLHISRVRSERKITMLNLQAQRAIQHNN